MSKPSAKPIIDDLPVEDFVVLNHGGYRDGAGRKRTFRRNITIYIKEEIIKAMGPHPATKLRVWIEANFPKET